MSKSRLAALGLACLVSGACTVVVQQAPEQEPAPTPRTTGPPRPTPVRRGQGPLGIPPGHLPGPGYCRVWVEDLPPGQQARARPCEGILPDAPQGSWILYRPASRQQEIRVRYLHGTKHGVVISVRVYEAPTGKYLRDLAFDEDDDNMGLARLTIRRPTTPVRRSPAAEGGRRGNVGGQTDTTRTSGNSGMPADTVSAQGRSGENRGQQGRGGNDERGREADDRPGRLGGDDETPLDADARAPLRIGARNFPSAGQCRVWVPGRPNGRQARAASCDGIANGAPAGAMILRRSPNEPNVILVDYIDEARAGRVVRTSVYDANSGEFIRDRRAGGR